MPNITALVSILAVMIAVYTVGMWVTRITNERGDEILLGVVQGVPVSSKYRWLMLFTQWFRQERQIRHSVLQCVRK